MLIFVPRGAAAPAPEASGPKATAAKPVEVEFSHKRGFYETPLELRLTAGPSHVEIRYTLDGSAPTPTSGLIFSNRLTLAKSSVIRCAPFDRGQRVGKIKTRTFIFPAEVVTQSADGLPPAGWHYAWGQNKVDYGMDPKIVRDPRFSGSLIEGLKTLPTFSLVMDPEDLFGQERGIYSHAQNDGRDAERPCSLELLFSDERKGFQEDCGVRIRGGFSRMPMNPKHAFRFFFRKTYGEGKLKFPLFGRDAAKEFDNFDLRCSQNYSWSLAGDHRGVFLRDQFNRDLQLAMNQPAVRGDFYHLYINGQYWGLYNTCERPEASFGASYLGGAKEDYDVIKPHGGFGGGGGASPFPTDGTVDAWKRLYDAARAGLADNAAYFRLQGRNPDGTRNRDFEVLLDPQNLIDYMLVIFYGGNLDAPVSRFMGNTGANNWYGLRNRRGDHGFQFIIWDAEHTLIELDEDRTGPFPAGDRFEQSNPQWLWQQCLENAEFRLLAADRMHRHFFRGGVFTPEAARQRFLARKQEIERAVVCESARWGDVAGTFRMGVPPRIGADGKEIAGPLTADDWRREVDRLLQDFFPRRPQAVLDQLWSHGLYPELAPPALPQPGGQVPAGFSAELKATAGKIYFTLDETDPRAIGGAVRSGARTYAAPVPISAPTTVKARTWLNGEWSPLTEAKFSPAKL